MYSIRPHISEQIPLDLPTSMYTIRPILQAAKQSTNESVLKDVQQRQDVLLGKIEQLYNQLVLHQNQSSKGNTTASPVVPVREELVVHLSAKQPSKAIVDLIEQFREKLDIRTFRHSSVRRENQTAKFPSTANQNSNRSLTVIWSEEENLPFMFHSHTQINDEQQIVTLLSNQLSNNK